MRENMTSISCYWPWPTQAYEREPDVDQLLLAGSQEFEYNQLLMDVSQEFEVETASLDQLVLTAIQAYEWEHDVDQLLMLLVMPAMSFGNSSNFSIHLTLDSDYA